MIRYTFFYVLFLSSVCGLYAQQTETFYNHSFYNPTFINPSFVGMKKNPQALLIGKRQWAGFTGAPELNMFLVDGKLKNKKVGLGLMIINDKRGLNKKTGGSLLYSYNLLLDKSSRISFGLSLGYYNNSILFQNAILQNTNDPLIATGNQKTGSFSAGAGLSYISKRIEVGLSAPKIIGRSLKYNTTIGGSASINEPNIFFLNAKYNHPLSAEKRMYLVPLLNARADLNTILQIDAGIMYDWRNKLWANVIYKSNYAISTGAGFVLYKRFSVGYSYDVIINSLAAYSGTSHELMINYVFGKIEDEEIEDLNDQKKAKTLTEILMERLLADIDAVYHDPNATPEQCVQLLDKISQFADSYSEDTFLLDKMKEGQKKIEMKKKSLEGMYVLIKGKIEMSGSTSMLSQKDFSDVSIALFNAKTNESLGLYKPKERNGKFVLILIPGESYTIEIKKAGYKTYSKTIETKVKSSSYEKELSVKLKKEKK